MVEWILKNNQKRRIDMIIYAGKDYYDVSRKAANIMSAQIDYYETKSSSWTGNRFYTNRNV